MTTPSPSKAAAAPPARDSGVEMPAKPYRGIAPFRFVDAPIFFGRQTEIAQLLRRVRMYRGVLFYGDSGAGKSSLLEAGFIPRAAASGFSPERVRLQPKEESEFVVRRVSQRESGSGPFLPSLLVGDDSAQASQELGRQEFERRVRIAAKAASAKKGPAPLLIFDQFEEFVTLFEVAPRGTETCEAAAAMQTAVLDLIGRLLDDPTLPVKLIFSFREDYLARIEKLLARSPELLGQRLRLLPPGTSELGKIVRRPLAVCGVEGRPLFDRRRFSPALRSALLRQLRGRSQQGLLNLSEVQIACLELWEAPDPRQLFFAGDPLRRTTLVRLYKWVLGSWAETLMLGRSQKSGVEGLLERHLIRALDAIGLPPRRWMSAFTLERRLMRALDAFTTTGRPRFIAVAALCRLVTGEGTRNVVSGANLLEDLREETRAKASEAAPVLEQLEQQGLIRHEVRNGTDYYEIVSEFLVPWIGEQKAARDRLSGILRQQRRVLGWAVGLLVVALGVLASFLAGALQDEGKARADATAAKTSAERKLAEAEEKLAESIRKESESRRQLEAASEAHTRAVIANGEADEKLTAALRDRQVAEAAAAALQRELEQIKAAFAALTKGSPSATGAAPQKDDAERQQLSDRYAKLLTDLTRSSEALESSVKGSEKPPTAPDDPVVLSGHTGDIWTVDFSPDGQRLVTAGADKTVRVWRRDGTSEAIFSASTSEGGATCAKFSPDGKFVAAGSNGSAVRLFNLAKRQPVRMADAHRDAVTWIAFDRTGRFVSTSADRKAKLWNLEGRELANFVVPRGFLTFAAFSPDGARLLTSGEDGTGRVWDPSNGREITAGRLDTRKPPSRSGAPVLRAEWQPLKGSNLAVAAAEKAAILWNTATGEILARVEAGAGVHQARFSHDGMRVATAGADGVARIWNVEDAVQKRPINQLLLAPHAGRVLTLAWSPDNRWLATASDDHIVNVWAVTNEAGVARVANAARAELSRRLEGHRGPIWWLSWSADSRFLATCSGFRKSDVKDAVGPAAVVQSKGAAFVQGDGTARVWRIAPPAVARGSRFAAPMPN